jgi:hypothetical protein
VQSAVQYVVQQNAQYLMRGCLEEVQQSIVEIKLIFLAPSLVVHPNEWAPRATKKETNHAFKCSYYREAVR